MNGRIIVIGAGIAGLTAAIYAQKSGFDVTLIEQHSIPGGMCTSWYKNGYLFEGGIHWMTGSSSDSALNKIWRDTGALSNDIEVHYPEIFKSLEWEGKEYFLYRNMEKSCDYFKEISPADSKTIDRLLADIQAIGKIEMPIMDIKGVKIDKSQKNPKPNMLNMLTVMPRMKQLKKISCDEYADQFSHSALRRLINCMPEYDALSLIFTLATLNKGDGGYPEGGSLPLARRMASTFTELGGHIMYKSKVKRVLITAGKASGIALDSPELAREELNADAVVITQDTLAAVDKLFAVQPSDEWIKQLRENTKPAACVFISVGVRTKLPSTPTFMLNEPIKIGDFTYESLSFNNYSGYSGYAPEGCTALTAILPGDSYDFWKSAKNAGSYEREKELLSNKIKGILLDRYPEIKAKFDVFDIATPLTYERYTGSYRGSWMSITGKGGKQQSYPCELSQVKGIYFAGQRSMEPGGLPVALMSGRRAAQMLCRQFDLEFNG